jgi:hypothetical protein
MLIIHMVYQRVANAADTPLSGAPQGGGVNQGNTGETRYFAAATSRYQVINREAVTDSG